MIVYSHRGIDLDRSEKFTENSLEAFRWAAQKGLGIEVDLQITRDHVLLAAHDANIEKWSEGRAKRLWNSFTNEEIGKLEAGFGPVLRFTQVLGLAEEFPALHLAVHLKGVNQTGPFVEQLVETLKARKELHSRILIFDLKKDIGMTLRRALPGVGLAQSVADAYDISRYQQLTGGTLFSVDEALPLSHIFNWAWLDEWDRMALNDPVKSLYTPEVVERFRKKGMKIAMISPELHAGEGHQDGANAKGMQKRWSSMMSLNPDAVCTDYPARFVVSLKTS